MTSSPAVCSDFLELFRFFRVFFFVVTSSASSSAGDVTAADAAGGSDDVTGAEDDDVIDWPRTSSVTSPSENGRISSSTVFTAR